MKRRGLPVACAAVVACVAVVALLLEALARVQSQSLVSTLEPVPVVHANDSQSLWRAARRREPTLLLRDLPVPGAQPWSAAPLLEACGEAEVTLASHALQYAVHGYRASLAAVGLADQAAGLESAVLGSSAEAWLDQQRRMTLRQFAGMLHRSPAARTGYSWLDQLSSSALFQLLLDVALPPRLRSTAAALLVLAGPPSIGDVELARVCPGLFAGSDTAALPGSDDVSGMGHGLEVLAATARRLELEQWRALGGATRVDQGGAGGPPLETEVSPEREEEEGEAMAAATAAAVAAEFMRRPVDWRHAELALFWGGTGSRKYPLHLDYPPGDVLMHVVSGCKEFVFLGHSEALVSTRIPGTPGFGLDVFHHRLGSRTAHFGAGRRVVVRAGETIYFPSTRPHAARNICPDTVALALRVLDGHHLERALARASGETFEPGEVPAFQPQPLA